ncbi:MAG: HepT-like ribonuclease domain-containing protein, partial [Candidatus Zixiibacteriota bacterium]
MSDRKDSDLVADILEAARRTKEYTRNMTFAGFEKDRKTQDAVVRNIEIVGEAVKLLS